MAETQTYSRTEIERYLQHKMSQQEMHDFEKALMNDPFLADALEGFSRSDTARAEQHLAEIERSITGDQQRAKVVTMPLQKTAWWKIAAVILVIISAGAITWSVVNNNSSFNKNKKQIAASTPVSASIEKDSLRPADKPVARLDVLPGKPFAAYKKNTSPIIHPDANSLVDNQKKEGAGREPADNNERSLASLAPAPAAINADIVSPKHMTLPTSSAQNEFKGMVADKPGEPLPFAALKDKNIGMSAVADGNGNFSLKTPDSVLEVNMVSPGYASAMAKIKSNKPDNKNALKDEELSLAEVVVAAKQKKKKNVVASVQADSSVAAEPVGGWKSFKQYLNRQLDSLQATEADRGFDENIVLEFSIDNKGRPTNIKAPAEIDKMMAEKAIQILSNGPGWNNKKKDKKVKVIIAF